MIDTHPQVLVIGGGAAGVAASVGAARAGASVVLLERYTYLGGKATGAQVGTVCGLYQFNKDKESDYIVKGFAKEFAEALKDKCKQEPMSNTAGLHYLPYYPFAFKRLCDDLVTEHKIEVCFHSNVSSVELSGNTITSVDAIVFDRNMKFFPGNNY